MPEIPNPVQNTPVQVPAPSPEVPPTSKPRLALPADIKVKATAKVNDLKEKVGELDPKRKKIVLGVGILFAIIILLLLLNIVAAIFKRPSAPAPSPTPVNTNQGSPLPIIITNPSRYATDEAVLKIENSLNEIEKSLNAINPQHPEIAVPNLDYNVKFD